MGEKKVAVIGGGVMGKGIAYEAARHHFQVTLVDQEQDVLDEVRSVMRRWDERGDAAVLPQIRFTTSLAEAVAGAELVIEAVPENLALKQAIFRQLDRLAPPETIFVSNTSTLSPTLLGAATQRPTQVMVMHFFNPVHRMMLVELVKGKETSPKTVRLAEEVAHQMGKESIVVNESPGFVTTRMSALIGNEAFLMLEEGIASAKEIDQALKLGLNFPMGPLELADLVGLDTRLNNLRSLHESLGEKYRPASLLVQYVEAGRLGRKSGRGVYEYPKEENHGRGGSD